MKAGSRFYRYFACSRHDYKDPDNPDKQILSLFCVITRLSVIRRKAWKADIVAILRDHAPVWSVMMFILSISGQASKQILSLFCVITLMSVMSG